ncbi:sugar ABC transporter substrate-binding protein [Vallitalea longa]|uniref:Sugar ABC transporter substrate-binding protein n=1 Tax=Vallitalea longa TaxID=2936439 RepID=A0A9W6DEJ7_9FIRM|nr:ABC transporter substrate-binding protein [Vallitalea longa]GKX30256.1 sugar ABC transporter substrate-binding protein [Vallitalea longa]
MRNLKKCIGVLLVISMIFSIGGCKSTSKTSSGNVTTISFWHVWNGSEGEMLQEIVDDFNNSQSEIKVEVLENATTEKQLTAITGGNPPDVGYLVDYRISKLASIGALTELDSMIEENKMDSANCVPELWNLGNYGGKQYGIPYTMDSYMLYYNKDLLEEVGLTEPPKTTSELFEYAEKLTKLDKNGEYTQLGFISDIPWIDILNWAFVYGADFYDSENDKLTCDSQSNIDALNFKLRSYQEPYEAEKVRKFKSGFGKYMSPNNPFFQNQLALDVEGQWFTTFIDKYAPDINYGIAPMPYPDGRPELANGGQLQGGMLYVPKGSKKQEAAFKFIDYLVSDEPYMKFCAGKGSIPTTYSALDNPKFLELAPALEPFVEIAKNGNAHAFPCIPFAKEYCDELNLQEEKFYSFEVTAEEAMANVVKKIKPLVDEWVKTR